MSSATCIADSFEQKAKHGVDAMWLISQQDAKENVNFLRINYIINMEEFSSW